MQGFQGQGNEEQRNKPEIKPVHLLTVSDQKSQLVYSPNIKKRFNHIDLAISCGGFAVPLC